MIKRASPRLVSTKSWSKLVSRSKFVKTLPPALKDDHSIGDIASLVENCATRCR
jgi:hypothetical protein